MVDLDRRWILDFIIQSIIIQEETRRLILIHHRYKYYRGINISIYNMQTQTQTKTHSQDRKLMRQILKKLNNHKLSFEFRQPVDWQLLCLYDYPNIIPQPMDLSTVANKLNSHQYRYIEEFFTDLELIWSNCVTYNGSLHWLGCSAIKLRTQTNRFAKNYFPKIKLLAKNQNLKLRQSQQNYQQMKAQNTQRHIQEAKIEEYAQSLNSGTVKEEITESNLSEGERELQLRQQLMDQMQLISDELIGKIFLMLKSTCQNCLNDDNQGNISVDLGKIDIRIIQKILSQLRLQDHNQILFNLN